MDGVIPAIRVYIVEVTRHWTRIQDTTSPAVLNWGSIFEAIKLST